MKTLLHTKYASPEFLQIIDVEKPVPKEKQLLIKVQATTVNRTDCATLRAHPAIMRLVTGLFKPRKSKLGTDFAGVVEAIGSKVTKYKIGDKVFGFGDMSLASHAEYVVVAENNPLGIIPEGFTFQQAAASLEGVHYALNFTNKVKISSATKILVNGATGAIGSACLQLAKYYGATVTAVCRGEHFKQVESMGANKLIDYTTEDFTKLNEQFDYVFDAVGKSSFGKCKALLKPKGTFLSSELGKGSQNIFLGLLTPIFCKKKVIFPFPANIQKSIDTICQIISEGKFDPLIDKEYAFADIINAYHHVEGGQKVGNVIINFEND